MSQSDEPGSQSLCIREMARAKVNLWLEIGGRYPDGYHRLSSLVMFADVADILSFSPGLSFSSRPDAGRLYGEAGPGWQLAVSGPFASAVPVEDNLVLTTARYLQERVHTAGLPCLPPGTFHLQKNLPVAAGLGGGSSDAAAVFRIMAGFAEYALGDFLADLGLSHEDIARQLGADIPVCLRQRPAMMSGIGETLSAQPGLPSLPIVLVNPGVPLSTADVFAKFSAPAKGHTPSPAALAGGARSKAGLLSFIATRRNDLEPPARQLRPLIHEVLQALVTQEGCALARLSGSGPTCFGLFSAQEFAIKAARNIQAQNPDWWIAPGNLNP